jgi:hypothetical protein
VYWADTGAFANESVIYFEDTESGEWIELDGNTEQNVRRALVPLAPDLLPFLEGLLAGRYEDRLDALDS